MNRRHFLARTATATAAVCMWKPVFSRARPGAGGGELLDLNGSWEVTQAGAADWMHAVVPGCIHTDLLAAGKIPDPFYRDNEQAIQWVGAATWVYRRRFQILPELLAHDRVLLRCDGLDTLAVIKLNGRELGRADNMFRVWEFDTKPMLRIGGNELEIIFTSPSPYMQDMEAKRKLPEWSGSHESSGRAWVRKEPCNFGWDWGPVLITCGIWRTIGLLAFDRARLADMLILQDHSVAGEVRLEIRVAAEIFQDLPLQASLRARHDGHEVAVKKIDLAAGQGQGVLEIKAPKLWWPAGMGGQPLYEVAVELLDAKGRVVDRQSRRIGLRTLKLLEPVGEHPLRFEVNGVSFFAKGANWIPADAFAGRVTPERLQRYMADAVAVNMNMLRFWGGGYYEEEALYDACDEMGICVWLDFKFACSSYPAFEPAFLENVRGEVRDNVRRLRHHPCIAVWCGNNEISLLTEDSWSDKAMGRTDYDRLFKDLIGGQVRELAPQASYVSGSPDCGDTHYWQVWHGSEPFEAYRTLTGFMSEFGFQSFPEPKTIRAFTTEADRASVVTPVMAWHQRDGSGKGNEVIRDTILRYFNPPKDFDSTLWLSQILQGNGIKTGAEHWRRSMPRSMGCLFWQYNDCWPAATWSSVDYFGRWKALHYLARHFYAPLLVSGLENSQSGAIDLFVVSDRLEACHGKLFWQTTDVQGKALSHGSQTLKIPPQKSQKVTTLDLAAVGQKQGFNHLLTWLKLVVDGRTESENLVLFVPPKEIPLADPQIKVDIASAPDGFLVTLTAEKPALWAWLSVEDTDAKFSDNFVQLAAKTPVRIMVHPEQPMSLADFSKALRVQSLFNTYAAV